MRTENKKNIEELADNIIKCINGNTKESIKQSIINLLQSNTITESIEKGNFVDWLNKLNDASKDYGRRNSVRPDNSVNESEATMSDVDFTAGAHWANDNKFITDEPIKDEELIKEFSKAIVENKYRTPLSKDDLAIWVTDTPKAVLRCVEIAKQHIASQANNSVENKIDDKKYDLIEWFGNHQEIIKDKYGYDQNYFKPLSFLESKDSIRMLFCGFELVLSSNGTYFLTDTTGG